MGATESYNKVTKSYNKVTKSYKLSKSYNKVTKSYKLSKSYNKVTTKLLVKLDSGYYTIIVCSSVSSICSDC